LAKESVSDENFIEMALGNIFPGQEARIEMTLIQPLPSENGGIDFCLPLSYFPIFDNLGFQIKFNC
jgi:hypothetical protein